MRCVSCGENITGNKGKGFPSHCPTCGHKTVTRPRESGLADRQIKKAIDRVSGEGRVHFLREHAGWELIRVLRHRRRNTGWVTVGLVGAGSLIAAVAAWTIVGIVAPILISVIWIGWAINRLRGKYPNVLELVDAFEEVNPSPCRIKTQGRHGGVGEDVEGQPDPVATGRLLVCDRQDYVDFYSANDFEIHAACAIVHGRDRPSERDREIVARLWNMPQADVFLVHDLTPRGLALAELVRESGHWFAGRAIVTIHDLGITGDQLDMVDGQWCALADIPDGGEARISARGLPEGKGAELTIFRPERLLKMTLLCIDQRRPFHEVDRSRAGDDGSVGGGG